MITVTAVASGRRVRIAVRAVAGRVRAEDRVRVVVRAGDQLARVRHVAAVTAAPAALMRHHLPADAELGE